jgi:hypothetical protein
LEGCEVKTREEIFDILKANPLFKQYSYHHSRLGSDDTQPWHALGARLNAVATCALAAGDERMSVYGITNLKEREQLLLRSAEWILNATPFLWSEFAERIANAAPLPKHVISSTLLPAPKMFWAREGGYLVKGETERFETNWIAVFHEARGVAVITNCDKIDDNDHCPEEMMGLEFSLIPYGLRWPQDFEKEVHPWVGNAVGMVLKRCAFLASAYVNKDKTRLSRHHRRQLERAGEPREKVEEQVHVVKLRREVKEAVKKSGDGTLSVEWQHQWWVSGHYRAQWYPHEEAHRVIWIAPYMKGPSDKPLLEKVYTVVR